MAASDDQPGFVYQGAENDRLFQSSYTHRNGNANCQACDSAQQVDRKKRPNHNPKIHYGIIGSGTHVIKDAAKRDLISGECLCFETEASGLMNDFPCLVIRGISDYCDSHKNDQWQKYAAATAAAYAKELLSVTRPVLFKPIPRALQVMEELGSLKQAVQSTCAAVANQKEETCKQTVLNWISSVDYGHRYSDILAERCQGTCEWLLESPKFKWWLQTVGGVLLCSGMAGAGKTFLSATVIQYLYSCQRDDPKIGVAYVFCDYRRHHEQNVHLLLLSILKQISQTLTSLPESLKSLYSIHQERGTRPEQEEILKSLHSVAETRSKVYLVIDALDECQKACLSDLISELRKFNNSSNVSILATCREIFPSMKVFNRCKKLEIRAADNDISLYLHDQSRRFHSGVVDDKLKSEIVTTVTEKANGMFLLAKLHMEKLVSSHSSGSLRETLQMIVDGDGLEDAYEKAIEQIKLQGNGDEVLAKQTLAWLVLTDHDFSASELRNILAIRPGVKVFDSTFAPAGSTISQVCAGLITINQTSDSIRLRHQTTLDFFTQPSQSFLDGMQKYLAEICLTYLLYDRPALSVFADLENDFVSGLYPYAARGWMHHLLHPTTQKSVDKRVLYALRDECLRIEPFSSGFQHWLSRVAQGLLIRFLKGRATPPLESIFDPCEWVSEWRSVSEFNCLLFRGPSQVLGVILLGAILPAALERSRLALASCSHPEHWKTMHNLEHREDSRSCQPECDVPDLLEVPMHVRKTFLDIHSISLHFMSRSFMYQYLTMISSQRLGLAQSSRTDTAHHRSQEELVNLATILLLVFSTGLEPKMNIDNYTFRFPTQEDPRRIFRQRRRFQKAILTQVIDEGPLIDQLLEQEAVYNYREYRYLRQVEVNLDHLLRKAGSYFGFKAIPFLVRSGADANANIPMGYDLGGTPMICVISARESTTQHVRHLLERGGHVNQLARQGYYGSSLIAACAKGRVDLVELLLQQPAINVNLEATVGASGTALIAACSKDRSSEAVDEPKCIEESLLHAETANRPVLEGNCDTVPMSACASGYMRIVDMLLEKGANLNQQSLAGSYGTALIAACANGHFRIVATLLAKNADIVLEGYCGTYLTARAAAVHSKCLLTLLLVADDTAVVEESILAGVAKNLDLARSSWPCFQSHVYVSISCLAESISQCRLAAKQLCVAIFYALIGADMAWADEFMDEALGCLRIYSSRHDSDWEASRILLQELKLDGESENDIRILPRLRAELRGADAASIQRPWRCVVASVVVLLQKFIKGEPLIPQSPSADDDHYMWDGSFSEEEDYC